MTALASRLKVASLVAGGYAAILLDSAMGLAVQSTLPVGTGYTTLEFKISFVRGMSETSGDRKSVV